MITGSITKRAAAAAAFRLDVSCEKKPDMATVIGFITVLCRIYSEN